MTQIWLSKISCHNQLLDGKKNSNLFTDSYPCNNADRRVKMHHVTHKAWVLMAYPTEKTKGEIDVN